MTSLDLALIFFLLLVVLNYLAKRSVLYPPFIFCALWLFDLVVIRLGLIELDPLHGNTLAIVAAGAASFSVGGLLAGLAPRELLRIHLFPLKPARTPDFFRNTLMIILLCGLPVMFYETWQLSNSQGGGIQILMQARLALIESIQNEEMSQMRVVGYSTLITSLAALLFATGKKDRQFWVVAVVAFIICILGTGRAALLSLISGLSATRLLQTNQESLRGAMRFLRWPIAFFFALCIGLIFTNKTPNYAASISGGTTGVVTFSVLSYIVGPLAAFDKVVQSPADFMSTGNYTFYFFLHMAGRLHLMDYTKPQVIAPVAFVPFATNVYTVYEHYFLELGIIGTLVLLLFIGLLHSLLYLKARQGGSFSIYLFAYSIYPVLMVFFVDCYNNIPGYLFAIAFGVLYFSIGSAPLRLLPAIPSARRKPLNG
jgi:oligosaccharide repeat unit polymerase